MTANKTSRVPTPGDQPARTARDAEVEELRAEVEWVIERNARLDAAIDRARMERAEAEDAETAAEARVASLTARLARIEALFSGGPDTSCRTWWRGDIGSGMEIECVEVPLADLRAALDGPR